VEHGTEVATQEHQQEHGRQREPAHQDGRRGPLTTRRCRFGVAGSRIWLPGGRKPVHEPRSEKQKRNGEQEPLRAAAQHADSPGPSPARPGEPEKRPIHEICSQHQRESEGDRHQCDGTGPNQGRAERAFGCLCRPVPQVRRESPKEHEQRRGNSHRERHTSAEQLRRYQGYGRYQRQRERHRVGNVLVEVCRGTKESCPEPPGHHADQGCRR
jgi:hypothetical protein